MSDAEDGCALGCWAICAILAIVYVSAVLYIVLHFVMKAW